MTMPEPAHWYKRKPYLHFDLPLSKKSATAYVCDPDQVARHTFYPFLTYELITPKFRKDPQTKKVIRDPITNKPLNESKKRPIAYPSHKDGYIFSYYKSLIEPNYEQWLKSENLTESVTAFRSTGENNVTLAKKAFDFIKANPGCQMIATDVEKFFDTINHRELKGIWKKCLNQSCLPNDHYAVYKAVTRYSTVDLRQVYKLFGIPIRGKSNKSEAPNRICTPKQFREKVIQRKLLNPAPGRSKGIGIPQGTSLSPLLSNMYMADLDSSMHRLVTSLCGRYWRYCDDILIVLPENCDANLLPHLDHLLNRLKLNRSEEKTQCLSSQDLPGKQLQYLGFIFNGSKTAIRSSSIHRYHRKLKKAIQATKFRQQRESEKNPEAPFRKQALYNMYSELPLRGKKIKERQKRHKYQGNFTHYLEKAAKTMQSPVIQRQRNKALKRFRKRIRQQF